jgi:aspartyl-tRNA(Asn)/glutamyl-tRNA(Gln) amidotransferase subunit A
MIGEDLRYASISELGGRLARRELSPLELTQATLGRAAELNQRLNCFITLLGDEALEAARVAERELAAGEVRGPLHGVPFSVKDLYATKGVRTTAGSKVLADWVPDFDATTVARLKAAGAILIGKCNTSEFAAGPTNNNVHYGPAHNPWDLSRIPGGSSGGSGAAVAAGLGAFSLGSDTGGSVRIPAAVCGVVGLKPTYGRVSKFGVSVLSWSLDTCGPLARTIEDAALVLEAIAGHDPRDPTSSRRPVGRYAAGLEPSTSSGQAIRGLRVGVPKEGFWERLDAEVESAVRGAIGKLAELGAAVEEISIPWVEHAFAPANMISWVESAAYHRTWQDRWADDYGEELQQRVLIGRAMSGPDYLMAQQARRAIVERTRALYDRIDLLATPTSPVPAPPIGAEKVQVGSGTEPVRSAMGRLCRLGSLSGFPAVAVPCGFTRDSLPISLHLMAAPWQERTAMKLAHAYEQATDWHARRPAL